jgi:hypothetical protein
MVIMSVGEDDENYVEKFEIVLFESVFEIVLESVFEILDFARVSCIHKNSSIA